VTDTVKQQRRPRTKSKDVDIDRRKKKSAVDSLSTTSACEEDKSSVRPFSKLVERSAAHAKQRMTDPYKILDRMSDNDVNFETSAFSLFIS
jgi:hypothetical protein